MKSSGRRPELIPNDDPRWHNKATKVEDIDFVPAPAPMQPPAKAACSECPFAKDSTPGYLGGYSADMYKPLLGGHVLFACHVARSQGVHPLDTANQRHCTGICHMRANMELPIDPESEIGAAMSMAGKDPEFFESFEQFKVHHEGG